MRGRRWRRRLGIAFLVLVALGPPFLFGLSNLYLASPMGRTFVASRISGAIHLETEVKGATWSPWNGFTIRGLLIQQPAALRSSLPAPLLSVESIRIHPDWKALAGRRMVVKGVEIRKPELAVPIELLSQIPVSPAPPPVAPKPPDLAAVAPAPNIPAPNIPAPNIPAPNIPAPNIPAPNIPAPNLAATQPGKAPEPAKTPAITAPTVWVTVSEARLSVLSVMSREPLCRISRIDGSIPIGGKASRSGLTLRGIKLIGQVPAEEWKIPLDWRSPVLHAGATKGEIMGIGCNLEAKLAFMPGMPFVIGALIPPQQGKDLVIRNATRAKVGTIAGQAVMQGSLLSPSSWRGQAILQALSVEAESAGRSTRFDRGQAVLVFMGGALRCIDARLVGEDASILGNAAVLSDGRFSAVARVVASPETLSALTRHTHPAGSSPQLMPLGTPQRAALDMRIFGSPGRVFYQPDPHAQPIRLD